VASPRSYWCFTNKSYPFVTPKRISIENNTKKWLFKGKKSLKALDMISKEHSKTTLRRGQQTGQAAIFQPAAVEKTLWVPAP
jgi:hypothetical protein